MAVTATVTPSSELAATVSSSTAPNVVTVTGGTTPSVTTINLANASSVTSTGDLTDVDTSSKQSGSVLSYNTITSKWEATNEPTNLTLNGGAF